MILFYSLRRLLRPGFPLGPCGPCNDGKEAARDEEICRRRLPGAVDGRGLLPAVLAEEVKEASSAMRLSGLR